ncbi:MAG: TlpA family protein disulfide reductase [Gammaproteobacteria bacterium]|nr:TlpA family protein disulfide reductase [Gammaproteobacteria bacterium]
MKNKSFLSLTMTAVIFSALFLSSAQAEIKGFQDFNGKTQKLENYTGKGKWLIVMMWASDCYICNREAHEYVDFHMLHSDKDATVLGISLDGEIKKEAAKGFIKKHAIDFPNLIAEPEYVSNLYQELSGQYFAGTPTFLIYAPDGELKAAQAGAVPVKLIEEFISKPQISKTAK